MGNDSVGTAAIHGAIVQQPNAQLYPVNSSMIVQTTRQKSANKRQTGTGVRTVRNQYQTTDLPHDSSTPATVQVGAEGNNGSIVSRGAQHTLQSLSSLQAGIRLSRGSKFTQQPTSVATGPSATPEIIMQQVIQSQQHQNTSLHPMESKGKMALMQSSKHSKVNSMMANSSARQQIPIAKGSRLGSLQANNHVQEPSLFKGANGSLSISKKGSLELSIHERQLLSQSVAADSPKIIREQMKLVHQRTKLANVSKQLTKNKKQQQQSSPLNKKGSLKDGEIIVRSCRNNSDISPRPGQEADAVQYASVLASSGMPSIDHASSIAVITNRAPQLSSSMQQQAQQDITGSGPNRIHAKKHKQHLSRQSMRSINAEKISSMKQQFRNAEHQSAILSIGGGKILPQVQTDTSKNSPDQRENAATLNREILKCSNKSSRKVSHARGTSRIRDQYMRIRDNQEEPIVRSTSREHPGNEQSQVNSTAQSKNTNRLETAEHKNSQRSSHRKSSLNNKRSYGGSQRTVSGSGRNSRNGSHTHSPFKNQNEGRGLSIPIFIKSNLNKKTVEQDPNDSLSRFQAKNPGIKLSQKKTDSFVIQDQTATFDSLKQGVSQQSPVDTAGSRFEGQKVIIAHNLATEMPLLSTRFARRPQADAPSTSKTLNFVAYRAQSRQVQYQTQVSNGGGDTTKNLDAGTITDDCFQTQGSPRGINQPHHLGVLVTKSLANKTRQRNQSVDLPENKNTVSKLPAASYNAKPHRCQIEETLARSLSRDCESTERDKQQVDLMSQSLIVTKLPEIPEAVKRQLQPQALKNMSTRSNQKRVIKPRLESGVESQNQSTQNRRRGGSNESQAEDYQNAAIQSSQHGQTRLFASSVTSNQKINTSDSQAPRHRSPLYSEGQQFVYSNIGGAITGTAASRQLFAANAGKQTTNTKTPNSQQLKELSLGNRQSQISKQKYQDNTNLVSLSSLESRPQNEHMEQQMEVLGHGAQTPFQLMNYHSELNSVKESVQSMPQSQHYVNEGLQGVNYMIQGNPMTNDLVRKNRKYGRASALHFMKQNFTAKALPQAHASSMGQVRWHKHQGQAGLSRSKDRLSNQQSKYSRFESSQRKHEVNGGSSKRITFQDVLTKNTTETNRNSTTRTSQYSSNVEAQSKVGFIGKGASPKLRASMIAQKSKAMAQKAAKERHKPANQSPRTTTQQKSKTKTGERRQQTVAEDAGVNSKKSLKGKSPLASRPLKAIQQPLLPQTSHQSPNNYADLVQKSQGTLLDINDNQYHHRNRSLTVIQQETEDFYQNSDLSPIDGQSTERKIQYQQQQISSNADSFGGRNREITHRSFRLEVENQVEHISPDAGILKLPIADNSAAAASKQQSNRTRMRNQSHKSSKSNGAAPQQRSQNQALNPYTDLVVASNNFVATDETQLQQLQKRAIETKTVPQTSQGVGQTINGLQVICVDKEQNITKNRKRKEKRFQHQNNVKRVVSIVNSRRTSMQDSSRLTPYAPQSEKAQSVLNSISQQSFQSRRSSENSYIIDENPEITSFKEQDAPFVKQELDQSFGEETVQQMEQTNQSDELGQPALDHQDSIVRIASVVEQPNSEQSYSNLTQQQPEAEATDETPHADEAGFAILQISFGRDDELRGLLAAADNAAKVQQRTKTQIKTLLTNTAQLETSSQKKSLVSQRRYEDGIATNRNGSPVFKTVQTTFNNKVTSKNDGVLIRGSPRPIARSIQRPRNGSPSPVKHSTKKQSKESLSKHLLSSVNLAESSGNFAFGGQKQMEISQEKIAKIHRQQMHCDTEEHRSNDKLLELEPHSFLTNMSGNILLDAGSTTSLSMNGNSGTKPSLIISTESLSRLLNVPRPAANQELMLLPDFKLAPLPITNKMLPSKYSLVKYQAFTVPTVMPVLEQFNF